MPAPGRHRGLDESEWGRDCVCECRREGGTLAGGYVGSGRGHKMKCGLLPEIGSSSNSPVCHISRISTRDACREPNVPAARCCCVSSFCSLRFLEGQEEICNMMRHKIMGEWQLGIRGFEAASKFVFQTNLRSLLSSEGVCWQVALTPNPSPGGRGEQEVVWRGCGRSLHRISLQLNSRVVRNPRSREVEPLAVLCYPVSLP